jgi:hypothetical protein
MTSSKPYRSLTRLEATATTARVLNLGAIVARHADDPDLIARPLFKHPDLNRAIILKHRLRSNEAEEFALPRATATKVLLPMDPDDLKRGARFMYIGQRRFEEVIAETFGIEAGRGGADYRTLMVLGETPSLDPFILREQLRRQGLEPAHCYFGLSPADTKRMLAFVQGEIEPLVQISVGGDLVVEAQAERLAQKLLANTADAELEPLRATLQLDRGQFQEGVFCWKAFLYYKWRLKDVLSHLGPFSLEMGTARPRSNVDAILLNLIETRRAEIRAGLTGSLLRIDELIAVYERAYQGLIRNGEPAGFRNFLLGAPAMFHELGERLGAVDHMTSYWRFRFPAQRPISVAGDELADILGDFESVLRFDAAAGGLDA